MNLTCRFYVVTEQLTFQVNNDLLLNLNMVCLLVWYLGDTEHVELCVKGVFVEISSQRSIAQIFLTNYR